MKTVTVTFPVQEAVEVVRLLRGESRCLIEQTEFMPDADINKRTNLVLSARERVVTELEGVADTDDTVSDPSQIDINIPSTNRKVYPYQVKQDAVVGNAVEMASGEAPIATLHGGISPNEFDQLSDEEYWHDQTMPDARPINGKPNGWLTNRFRK